MVKEDLPLSKILTRQAFENAIIVNAAIGGSTNVILHLLAIAGRIGIDLCLQDFDRLGADIPLLVNLKPAGEFLMEEFYYAGGLPVVLQNLARLSDLDVITVTGTSHAENTAGAACYDDKVIAGLDQPFQQQAGIAVLRGNLCPDGAVIKPSAATPGLLRHRGKAVVFASVADFHTASTIPNSMSTKTRCWCCRMSAPRDSPACPKSAI